MARKKKTGMLSEADYAFGFLFVDAEDKEVVPIYWGKVIYNSSVADLLHANCVVGYADSEEQGEAFVDAIKDGMRFNIFKDEPSRKWVPCQKKKPRRKLK